MDQNKKGNQYFYTGALGLALAALPLILGFFKPFAGIWLLIWAIVSIPVGIVSIALIAAAVVAKFSKTKSKPEI
ncbi:MAG: hypothetical protein HYV68_03720 [Candidatus Taylorbacteria bacterium]|nr:hypothetical protein [Candidatus Taylorbacteria bacterium]